MAVMTPETWRVKAAKSALRKATKAAKVWAAEVALRGDKNPTAVRMLAFYEEMAAAARKEIP